MNPQIAADNTLMKLKSGPGRDQDGKTTEHAVWMLEGISNGYIQNEKAHRWLGYAQAVLVINDVFTLSQVKMINKFASDD